MSAKRPSVFKRIAAIMGWTPDSYYLLSAFLLTVFLIAYLWWPLAEDALAYVDWNGSWWLYFDWLLVGIFLVMSLLIMAGADLKADAWIVFVGLFGGLVIEGWGTQTEIWWYYTAERPPLWIIPAWPIASLSIDRIVRVLLKIRLRSVGSAKPADGMFQNLSTRSPHFIYRLLYWIMFPGFYVLLLSFIWPTMDKSLTIMALILVTFLVLTPTDYRLAVLTFIAGSGLGYFLEFWGTTRECWVYYTVEKPPIFAVLAHGMAAVAFWRSVLVLKVFSVRIFWVSRKGKTKRQSR